MYLHDLIFLSGVVDECCSESGACNIPALTDEGIEGASAIAAVLSITSVSKRSVRVSTFSLTIGGIEIRMNQGRIRMNQI